MCVRERERERELIALYRIVHKPSKQNVNYKTFVESRIFVILNSVKPLVECCTESICEPVYVFTAFFLDRRFF